MNTLNRRRLVFTLGASRSGAALILSLVAVGVIGIIAAAFLQLSASVTRRQVGAVDTKLAFYLAEAGLAESYTGIVVGKTGRVGSEADPAILGDGLLWVDVDVIDVDHVELKATGMAKTGKATLGLVLERGTPNVKGLGVFALNDLTVLAGTLIDGFDSDQGPYVAEPPDPAKAQVARVSSNGSITVIGTEDDATVIKGDVRPGPLGTVTEVGVATITGGTDAASSATTFPALVIPTVPMTGGVTHRAGAPLIVPSGALGANYLHLNANADVTLQGPLTLVLGGLRLAPQSQLVFDTTSGAIQVYVSNYVDVHSLASLVSNEPHASKIMISIDGDVPVDFASSGPFYATIFAPDATVLLGSGFELFGAVSASTLSIGGGAALHYDLALARIGAEEELPTKISWRIVDLPQSISGSARGNPFLLLGVDPALLALPSAAHADQTINVDYLDLGGVPRSYAGLESGFDWSQVSDLTSLRRTGGMVDGDVAKIAREGGYDLSFNQ